MVNSRLHSLKFVYVSRGSRDLAGQAFLFLSVASFFLSLLLQFLSRIFFLFTCVTRTEKGRPAKEVK